MKGRREMLTTNNLMRVDGRHSLRVCSEITELHKRPEICALSQTTWHQRLQLLCWPSMISDEWSTGRSFGPGGTSEPEPVRKDCQLSISGRGTAAFFSSASEEGGKEGPDGEMSTICPVVSHFRGEIGAIGGRDLNTRAHIGMSKALCAIPARRSE